MANLQLLNGRLNESKNATPLINWIASMTEAEQSRFRQDNYFPEEVGLEFAKFIAFYQKRKEILFTKLKEVLVVKDGAN